MFKAAVYKFVFLVVSFLAVMVLSNYLHPSRFGMISILSMNAAVFSILTGMGAESIVIHKQTNRVWNEKQSFSFLVQTIILQLGAFLLCEFACFIFSRKTILAGLPQYALPYELLFFAGLIITEKYSTLLYVNKRAVIANVILLCMGLAYFGVIIVVGHMLEQAGLEPLLLLIAAYSLATALALAIYFHSVETSLSVKLNSWIVVLRELSVSGTIVLTNGVQFLAYRIDYWIILAFFSSYSVGIWSQANKVANLLWILPNVVAQLVAVRFARMPHKDLMLFFRAGFVLNLLLALGTVVAANIIFNIVLDPAYYPGLQLVLIMLPGYFCWSLVLYIAAYFATMGLFKYNLLSSIACFVLMLIVDLILIPTMGLAGGAVANTTVYFIVLLYNLHLLKKLVGFPIREFLKFEKSDLPNIKKMVLANE